MTFWKLVAAIVVGEYIYSWVVAFTDVVLSRLLRKRITAKLAQAQMERIAQVQLANMPMGRAN